MKATGPTRRACPRARLKDSALRGTPGYAGGPATAGVPPGLPVGKAARRTPAGGGPPPWARRRPARRRDAPRSGDNARPWARAQAPGHATGAQHEGDEAEEGASWAPERWKPCSTVREARVRPEAPVAEQRGEETAQGSLVVDVLEEATT
eukprot:4341012-Alexandrium_andersonii.AAC.1